MIPFTLCGLLLAGAIFWQVVHGQRLGALEDRRQHLGREIRVARSVVTGILDAETGQRGFLLTGREAYLTPYEQASQILLPELDRVIAATADNDRQQERLRRARLLIGHKLVELSQTIEQKRTGRNEEAMNTVLTDRGKGYMDELRGLLQLGAPSWTANGTVAATMTTLGRTGASTIIRKWLTVKDDGGTTYYIAAH